MALTNKGAAWERKNSLYTIFSFIPVLNCIPFFHMHSRIENKRWALLGWFSIIVQILIIIALFFIPSIQYSNAPERPRYSDVAGVNPSVEDFMSQEQKAKYYEDSSYINSTEFKLSEEYENYQQAYEQYWVDLREWEQRPEIAAQISEYENYGSVWGGILIALCIAFFIIYLLLIIISFTERPRYLKLLAQNENKNSITTRIKSVKDNRNNIDENQNTKPKNAPTNSTAKTDINSADEDALSTLKGITIIDAKKAIAYREEHGGFNNTGEFFACINAKPHIIAAIEEQLTVGDYKTKKTSRSENNGKRQLDL